MMYRQRDARRGLNYLRLRGEERIERNVIHCLLVIREVHICKVTHLLLSFAEFADAKRFNK